MPLEILIGETTEKCIIMNGLENNCDSTNFDLRKDQARQRSLFIIKYY